jgi:hypothetical protein
LNNLLLPCADVFEQFIERLRCHLLAARKRAKDIDKQQADADNLLQQRIVERGLQLAEDDIAHPFAAGLTQYLGVFRDGAVLLLREFHRYGTYPVGCAVGI